MHLGIALFKYFPYGGLQKDVLRIAEEALARGHRVTVFTREWRGDRPQGLELVLAPSGWKKGGWQNHARDRNFARWLASVRGDYGLDALLGFNRMPGLDFYFAADPCYRANRAQSWRRRLSPRARHFLDFERAVFAPGLDTHIFYLTERQKREYRDCYATEEARFTPVPPGISRDFAYDPEAASAARRFVRDRVGAGEGELVCLHVGSDFRRKGVDRCIEALVERPGLRLAVVGQGSADNYLQLAKRLGVAERVHFAGPSQQVRQWMLGADLLLHPAREEAAGMVLVEALIAGLPVIVSGGSGYATHIALSRAGRVLAEPFAPEQLREALGEAQDNAVRERWHKSALAYAEETDLYNLGPVVLEQIRSRLEKRGD